MLNENDEAKSNNGSSIDIGQLAALLKNVDINQVLGLLNTIDISQLSSLFGGLGNMGMSPNLNAAPKGNRGKEVEILSAMKPMLAQERADLIDMILQIYTISKILKG